MSTPLAAVNGTGGTTPSPVLPVIYTITVNGTVSTETPLDVELRQAWGQHDVFFVRIELPRTTLGINTRSIWANNAPVQVVWGLTPGDTNTWYGYVNHHNFRANADSGSRTVQIQYTLLGTSKPMNTDVYKNWGSVTASYIATTLAAKYQMRLVTTTSNNRATYKLPYEVQANESDFHFMCRIASKVGFRFWVSGGTFYFIEPASQIQSSATQAIPIFYLNKFMWVMDTVRDFTLNQGDNLPGATVANRSLWGVDPTNNTVFEATATSNTTSTSNTGAGNIQGDTVAQLAALVSAANSASTTVNATDTTGIISTDFAAISYADALQIVNARQALSQFWLAASAELYGNTLIYPGKIVQLAGVQLPPDCLGNWLVSSCCHILKSSWTGAGVLDRYVTQVEILKNSSGNTLNLAGSNTASPEFNTMTLSSGTWKATTTGTITTGGGSGQTETPGTPGTIGNSG
jgi:phage protein D